MPFDRGKIEVLSNMMYLSWANIQISPNGHIRAAIWSWKFPFVPAIFARIVRIKIVKYQQSVPKAKLQRQTCLWE